MEAKDILTIAFSSTLITTLITGMLNLLTSKKKDAIENITKERKEWRDQLRIISKAIAESENIAQLHVAISDLKVRINAYGIAKNFVFYDTHFWKQINRLESDNNNSYSEENLKDIKIAFVNQISCLLKYDWERSKAEIKGNTQTKIVAISLMISFFFYSLRWFYYYSSGTGKIDDYLSYCILYTLLVAFSVLVIYGANKWKNSFQFYSYIILSLLGGVCLYLFVYSTVPSERSSDIIDAIICASPYLGPTP